MFDVVKVGSLVVNVVESCEVVVGGGVAVGVVVTVGA